MLFHRPYEVIQEPRLCLVLIGDFTVYSVLFFTSMYFNFPEVWTFCKFGVNKLDNRVPVYREQGRHFREGNRYSKLHVICACTYIGFTYIHLNYAYYLIIRSADIYLISFQTTFLCDLLHTPPPAPTVPNGTCTIITHCIWNCTQTS